VVAGEASGRRLDAPGGTATRPTADRVREAVFNALDSLDAVSGARVLDAFAGSGALGIEALSRGAAWCTFADTDAAARAVVEANLASVGYASSAEVLATSGLVAARGHGPWDLVLLDPPYDHRGWDELLGAVAASLSPGGVVVAESDRAIDVPAPLGVLRVKRYGGTVVTFAARPGAPT
jgi:16S rRNA (guanine966-N2)-methyltransferase